MVGSQQRFMNRRRVVGARRSRLGLPRVNPDPRPPNENLPGGRPNVNQHHGPRGSNGGRNGLPGLPNNNSPFPQNNHNHHNGGGEGGHGDKHLSPAEKIVKKLGKMEKKAISQGAKPVATTAPIQALNQQAVQRQIANLDSNPLNALAFSSFKPGPGQVDPRDENYWRNVHDLVAKTSSAYNDAELQGQRAEIDRNTILGDMTMGHGRQERQLAEEAMRSGLSNSGWLNTADAEGDYDFLRDYEDTTSNFERNKADRAMGQSSLIQEFLASERGLAEDAVSRFSEAELAEAAEGDPLYNNRDVRRIAKILRAKRKKGNKR